MTMTENIQRAIDGRELPFPIRVAVTGATSTLTVTSRDHSGRTYNSTTLFPTPTDAVILDGFTAALDSALAQAYQSTHMGLEVV